MGALVRPPPPFLCSTCLQALLEQLLEDTTFQALQANLQPPAAGSANGSNGGAAGAVVAAAASPSPLVLAAYAGGGSGSTAAAAAAALADARAATAAAERCCLLNILILIYYHPRKQCTPDRFLSLASLFHATLFTRPSPRGGAAGGAEGEPTAAAMSVKLVSWAAGLRWHLWGWGWAGCFIPWCMLCAFALPCPAPSRFWLALIQLVLSIPASGHRAAARDARRGQSAGGAGSAAGWWEG